MADQAISTHQRSIVTLGTMEIGERTVGAIHDAIALGYRSFDTAPIYGNEAAVGEAIRFAPVDRSELSVTTKLWNSSHRFDDALRAFDRSLARLQLDWVDLYLVHWPVPSRGRFVEAWQALVRLQDEGRVKSIGVSNFLPEHLERIIDATGVVPAVNQVESNPSCQRPYLIEEHRRLGIVTQAWSPLGNGVNLADPVIAGIARAEGRSPAQVILRWQVQRGVHPVVKASSASHMGENIALGEFTLDESEMAAISQLDRDTSCFGVDPLTFVCPPGMEEFCP